MQSLFTRTEMLFGTAAMQALEATHVAVFGVGGVGSYVVEVLARSGIGQLTLIDNDVVSPSNINRQLVALHSTVGQKKVEVARQRVLDINPRCVVRTYPLFYLPENADQIDLSTCNYVADCIDTVAAKIELIRRCHALQVPVIASMGAANKLDPTRFKVTDVFETRMDPLAKVLRKKLRKLGIDSLRVVCSDEPPLEPLSIASQHTAVDAASLQTNPKRAIPASNSFVPAAAGLVLGGQIVKDLIAKAGAMRNS